ncbi:hypothetical protein [Almyronema epifaneia]|uniref:hypothetical protein n=1 Tax=Almyronema epifaneia TaxID=3114805 RepID=UPI00366E77DC
MLLLSALAIVFTNAACDRAAGFKQMFEKLRVVILGTHRFSLAAFEKREIGLAVPPFKREFRGI